MSDSNALVKLFGNLMGGLDDDDDKKKAQGLVPVPQLAIPPQVTPPVPAQAPQGVVPSQVVPAPVQQGVPPLLARQAPAQQAAPTPVQQGVPPLLARPVQQGVPVDFDPAKLVPIELTQEEEDWIAAQQGVPAQSETPSPSFIDKALASAGLPSTDAMKRQAGKYWQMTKRDFSSAEDFGRALGHAITTPQVLAWEGIKGGSDLLAEGAEVVGDPLLRFGQGLVGSEVTGVDEGDFGRWSPEGEGEVPAVEGVPLDLEADLPLDLLDVDTAKVEEVEEVEEESVAVVDPNKMTTAQLIARDDANENFMGQKEFAEDKAAIDKLTAEQDEDAETLIKDDDKRESFLSKLWDGVKSVVSEQFQDPTNQKALFAYAISRATGGDGATLAGKVLEAGWAEQAATKKHERELEKYYGKEAVTAQKKRIADEVIDYSKPVTVYHPKTQENYTIFRTKGGDQFVWEVGGSKKAMDISEILGDGYEFKTGLTQKDHKTSMLKTLTDDTARAFEFISSEDIDDETKAAIRQGIDPAELRSAIDNFVGQYPKGTDFVNSTVMNSISKAAGNYVQAIKDGRAVGSKDLTGYLDYEVLKHDIKDNGLPSTFFLIAGNPEQEIGVNGWSKVNRKVNGLMQSVNNQLLEADKDAQPMTKGEVYKALYDEYVTMGTASIDPKNLDDNPFATYWEKVSVESSDDEHLSLSAAMSWLQSINEKPDPPYTPPNGGALIKTLVANRLGKP